MKRQTAMALAAVFAMSVAGTALAAPANPFVDVPAKHWAYDSINKLAQAGVISGYGDGTYKGDRTLTRYEVATIVAKAMANSDKADAATKREIEALKAEFGTELNNLGVRVDNLEKNSSKVKFTGEIRERYEWNDEVAKNGDRTGEKTRVRISMTAPIDENVTFKGRFHSESEWGSSTGSEAKIDQAYITGKINGLGYSFGRQPIVLGQKLLSNNTQYNDGLSLSAGKDIKVTAYAFKKEEAFSGAKDADGNAITDNLNFTAGNIDFKVNKNLNITASYLADKDELYYKSVAAGLKYTGWKDFTVTGEYGENDSYTANSSKYNGDTAKAWASRIKYKGAIASKAHSYGLYVSYRKAESGFDPRNWNDFTDNTTWNGIKEMDDIKGVDYGFEYALFKNGIMRIQYNDMEDEKTGTHNKNNMFAELIYTF